MLLGANVLLMFGIRGDHVHVQIGSAVAVIKLRNGNQLKPRSSLSDVVALPCPCSHPVEWLVEQG